MTENLNIPIATDPSFESMLDEIGKAKLASVLAAKYKSPTAEDREFEASVLLADVKTQIASPPEPQFHPKENDRTLAARARALRSNMYKKLDKAFPDYVNFTTADAAYATNQKETAVHAFLNYESQIRGSRVQHIAGNIYRLVTAFEVGN